jgi:hypothetical protein
VDGQVVAIALVFTDQPRHLFFEFRCERMVRGLAEANYIAYVSEDCLIGIGVQVVLAQWPELHVAGLPLGVSHQR